MVRMSEGHLQCVHSVIRFSERTKNLQFGSKMITQNLSAFHLSRRVSNENRACSISIRFFQN